MDDCRFCAHNKESLERCERTCEGDFKQSVSRRLWKEELYRGMLNGLKLKWQPFSQWSGAGSKAWTWFLEQHPPGSGFVCGSGGENKELDCLRPKRRRRWGGRESVSCVSWRKMLSDFTRCCPTAVARKHFILFPGPRQHSHWDQSSSVTCFKSWSVLNSSQGHNGRFQQQKQSARLCLLCASVVSFYIYHTQILAKDVLFCFAFFFLVPQQSDEWFIVVVGWHCFLQGAWP